jgi:hypothetical protein
MARRRLAQNQPGARRLKRKATTPNLPWPNIEAFIDCDGHIAIGRTGPIDCAAIANDDHNMLVALVRQPGETFTQLLDRLDRAIELAVNEETFTDEINR